MKPLHLPSFLALALTACHAAPAPVAPATASVVVRLAPAARGLLATLPTFEGRRASFAGVHHLVFALYRLDGATETELLRQTVRPGDGAAGVPFTGLPLNTAYRVKAYAYDDATASAASQTSVDAGSQADFTIGPLPDVGTVIVPLRLIDVARSALFQPFAGNAGSTGSADGSGTAARFNAPTALAADGTGKLYVADTGQHTIRLIDGTGATSLVAGQAGTAANAMGNKANARFDDPRGIAADASAIYVADTGTNRIKVIDLAVATTNAGYVTLLAGATGADLKDGRDTAARFNAPTGLALAGTALYVADTGNHAIRKVNLALAVSNAGYVTTLAGTDTAGAVDASGAAARFNGPTGVAAGTDGTVYVADTENNLVRAITAAGAVTTLAGDLATRVAGGNDGPAAGATFTKPAALALAGASHLYVSEPTEHRIRLIRLDLAKTHPRYVTTLVDGGAGARVGIAADTALNKPYGLAVAGTDRFVAEQGNHTIRRFD